MGSASRGVGYIAVILLGLSCGVMLTGAVILVPFWRSLPAGEFLAWFAANAERLHWLAGSLQVGAMLFSILSAVLFAKAHRSGTLLFGVAALLAIAVLATVLLYFHAVNASFVDGSIPLDRVPAELAQWASWQWARMAAGLAAFCLAMIAMGGGGRAVAA